MSAKFGLSTKIVMPAKKSEKKREIGKIAFLTAKRAKKEAEKIAEKYGCKVVAAKNEIASLIRLSDLGDKELEEIKSSRLLLLPGYCSSSLAEAIERKTGTETFLGPKAIADLPVVLENLGKIRLSKSIPANELIEEEIKIKAEEELKQAEKEEKSANLMKSKKAIKIGKIAVSNELPMRIIAEIPNAEKLDKNALLKKAKYFEKEGASIIALGFSGTSQGKLKKYVEFLKSKLTIPIAVDAGSEEEMHAALKSDAELLMSFDRKMLSKFSNISKHSVIIPEANAKSADEKVSSLMKNIALARKRGFTSLIADLILEPFNFGAVESIIAYKKFYKKFEEENKKKNKKNDFIPILFGAGNITELIDADSVGVNAALAALASECGASLIFTVEASDKCRGSVRELATASKMLYLAKKRGSYPKDLGINMLFLKEKTRKERTPLIKLKGARIIDAESKREGKSESSKAIAFDDGAFDNGDFDNGEFVVFLKEDGEEKERKIFAVHFPAHRKPKKPEVVKPEVVKPDVVIKGKNASDICREISELGLVKEIEHAMYIALELQKAEIALRTGRSYVQEERVF